MRRRHPTPEELRLVSLADVAMGIGRSPSQTRKLIGKLTFLPPTRRQGRKRLFPVELIDILNEMLERPNQLPSPASVDWLTSYLEGDTDAR